jgi:hypothetical protein
MAVSPRDDGTNDSVSEVESVDWRTRIAAHLTEDLPPAYPGEPSAKADALVVQSTPARDANGHYVSFTTSSAVALALSLAMKSADQAQELRKQIERTTVVSPFGASTSVTHESKPALFDYLECCMAVLTFSFQALEAYSNEIISEKVPGHFVRRYRKDVRQVTAEELERDASTEEKVGTILPKLLGVKTPKGTRLWEDFFELKGARDATIHIKSRDSSPRVKQPGDLDTATLFHRLLGADASTWIRGAVTMIDYFATAGLTPQWLPHVKSKVGVRSKNLPSNQRKLSPPPRGDRRKIQASGPVRQSHSDRT